MAEADGDVMGYVLVGNLLVLPDQRWLRRFASRKAAIRLLEKWLVRREVAKVAL